MRRRLILIGGAPGVGKSTVARRLSAELPESVWLDGDDLWRMQPFRVNERRKAMVERSIVAVLRNLLAADFPWVLFTWVLHDEALIERLVAGLDGLDFERFTITLVCERATWEERFRADPARDLLTDHHRQRFAQQARLPTHAIDTTKLDPAHVAAEILSFVRSCPSEPSKP